MQKTKGEFPPSGNPTLFNIEIGKALFLGSTPVKQHLNRNSTSLNNAMTTVSSAVQRSHNTKETSPICLYQTGISSTCTDSETHTFTRMMGQ